MHSLNRGLQLPSRSGLYASALVVVSVNLTFSVPAGAQPTTDKPAVADKSNTDKPLADKPAPPKEPNPPTEPVSAAAAPESDDIKGISDKLDSQAKLAEAARRQILTQKGKNLSKARADALEAQTNASVALLASFRARLDTLKKRNPASDAEKATFKQQTEELKAEVSALDVALAGISKELSDATKATGWSLVDTLLDARCATAICFANGAIAKNWLGIEPLVELPVGKSFATGGTALSDWVNNHDLRVDLAAGIRVWFFRDVVSVSMYLSKPLNDTPVRLKGDSFVYPGASIRRPYPGLSVGLLFDSIWIGFDRDELRNGDGQSATTSSGVPSGAVNPKFPPNETISSSWTVTIALQPVTAFRTALGTAVQSAKGKP